MGSASNNSKNKIKVMNLAIICKFDRAILSGLLLESALQITQSIITINYENFPCHRTVINDTISQISIFRGVRLFVESHATDDGAKSQPEGHTALGSLYFKWHFIDKDQSIFSKRKASDCFSLSHMSHPFLPASRHCPGILIFPARSPPTCFPCVPHQFSEHHEATVLPGTHLEPCPALHIFSISILNQAALIRPFGERLCFPAIQGVVSL